MKEKMLKIIKSKELYLGVGLIIVSLLFTKQILNANGVGHFILIGLVEVIVEGGAFLVLYKMRVKQISVEKQFLFAGILLGVLFIIILPPGQAPDEINHFRRAYGISQGEIIANTKINEAGNVGGELPVEIETLQAMPSNNTYKRIFDELARGDSGETSEQNYTTAALYNFVCYLPQAVAALVGRLLNLPVLAIAYLMKACNFIVWVLLVYFGIKLIPKFKTMVLFVALLPVTLQEATSLAPDALTIGLGIFLVAYVMHLAYAKKGAISKRELAVLYIMAAVIGLCKIVYFPLALLYSVIPYERFGSKKRKWVHLGTIAGVMLILNLSWLMISANLLAEFRPGVDPGQQVIYILTHLMQFIMTIVRSVNTYAEFWLTNMFGILIGSFSFRLPNVLFFVSVAIFVLLVMQRDETLRLKRFDRAVFIATFGCIVLLIFTSLYVQWTAVGAEEVDGVQGRYFLPVLPLIPVMVCRQKDERKKYAALISDKAVLYYGTFINIVALMTIFAQNA